MENNEDEINNSGSSLGGGLIGLVVLYLLGAWFLHLWPFNPDYSKPWWDGTKRQKVCAISRTTDNCSNLYVTVEDEEIVELEFPNGNNVDIVKVACGKAETFKGRYCDISDVNGREWEIKED